MRRRRGERCARCGVALRLVAPADREGGCADEAAATTATTAEHAVVVAAAKVAAEATASSGTAGSVSSGAGSLTASAGRIASELKTLDSYLTTTPAGQLDPGYISSQAAYLAQQLTRLQTDAGNLGDSVTSFEAAVRKLSRDAGGLKRR